MLGNDFRVFSHNLLVLPQVSPPQISPCKFSPLPSLTTISFYRSFCQYYDMQEHSTKVFHDLVNSLATFIQSLYSGAGQQSSSVTPPHTPSSQSAPPTLSSPGSSAANGSAHVPGFHYHGVWLPLVKLPSGQAKPV